MEVKYYPEPMMARRKNKDHPSGDLVLIFIVLVIVVVPAVLTLATYGGLFSILVGLAIFEMLTGKRPDAINAKQLSSEEECSALDMLQQKLEASYRQKSLIYL